LPLLSGKLALVVVCLLGLYKTLFLLSCEAIDAVSNGVIMPVTEPCSMAVLVSTSNANILRSFFLILLNGFFPKSLSKYCLIDTVLKVAVGSLLYL